MYAGIIGIFWSDDSLGIRPRVASVASRLYTLITARWSPRWVGKRTVHPWPSHIGTYYFPTICPSTVPFDWLMWDYIGGGVSVFIRRYLASHED